MSDSMRKITIAIVDMMISTLLIVGYHVSNFKRIEMPIIVVLIWGLLLIVNYFILSKIYSFFESKKQKSNLRFTPVQIFVFSFVGLILVYSVNLLVFYPGIFAFDAPGQLFMFLQHQISVWHPVLHTVILGKIMVLAVWLGGSLTDGVVAYSVIQYTVTALCFSYVLKYIYSRCKNLIIWGVSFVYLAFFPTITLQVMSVTKDSYFMVFFVMAVTLIIEFLSYEEAFIGSRYKSVLLILSALGMLIFRNNCIYVAPLLAILILIVAKRKKYAALVIISTVILFMVYKMAFVSHWATVYDNECEKLSVPSQQLVNIYRDDSADMTDSERTVIENLIYIEGRDGYVPESADIVKANINMDYYENNKKTVRKLWWNLVCRNPKQAWEAFAQLNCGLWYPFHDLTLYGDGTKGYWVVNCYYPIEMQSKLPGLLNFYKLFEKTDFSGWKTLIYIWFAPAVFFYMFCVMFGYAAIKKNRSFLVIFIYTLAYWATFLLGPMALVRYVTFMYAMAPLYFVLIADHKDSVQNEQTEMSV